MPKNQVVFNDLFEFFYDYQRKKSDFLNELNLKDFKHYNSSEFFCFFKNYLISNFSPSDILSLFSKIFPQWHSYKLEMIGSHKAQRRSILENFSEAHVQLYEYILLFDQIENCNLFEPEIVSDLLGENFIELKEGILFPSFSIFKYQSQELISKKIKSDLNKVIETVMSENHMQFRAFNHGYYRINKEKFDKLNTMFYKFYCDVSEKLQMATTSAASTRVNANILFQAGEILQDSKPFYQLIDGKINDITQLTQMIAHDLKKPFVLIESFLALLEDVSDLNGYKNLAKSFENEIINSVKNADSMLEDLLFVDSDRKMEYDSHKLDALIKESLFECFKVYHQANIEITMEYQHSNKVLCDKTQILRVFNNILTNAIQAMNGNGSIWIKTTDVKVGGLSYIQICLGNNNSRIDFKEKDMIFDVFFTKNKENGTGLGLNISKKIIRKHGGDIWCTPLPDDQGVEFYFLIPASEFDTNHENILHFKSHDFCYMPIDKETAKNQKSKVRKQVAILDDNIMMLYSWSKVLPDAQCYRCPEEFFKDLEEFQINLNSLDCILTDYHFDDVSSLYNGVSFIKQLREKGYTGKIYLITSSHESFDENGYNFSVIAKKHPKLLLNEIVEV